VGRNRPLALSVFLFVAPALPMSAACSSEPACFGAQVGDTYSITILGPAGADSDASGPNCDFGFDVQQGQVLHAEAVQSLAGRACQEAIVSFDSFGSWTWTLDSNQGTTGVDRMLVGKFVATSGSCTGTVLVAINPESSVAPNAVMSRSFQGGSPGDPTCHPCDGAFVVSVQKTGGP
jgi:hypothetical protein